MNNNSIKMNNIKMNNNNIKMNNNNIKMNNNNIKMNNNNQKEPIVIWYTFFSWWIFIWFILFKLNLIPYSPFLIYVIVFVYILAKITQHLFVLKKEDYKHKNFNVVLIWLLIAILIDLVPIFFLKPIINMESFLFTVFLIAIYIVFMTRMKINVINHYMFLDMKTLMKYFDKEKILKRMIIQNQ